MNKEEFKEIFEEQLDKIGLKLSENQIEKFYLYMRNFARMESENKFNSYKRAKRSN